MKVLVIVLSGMFLLTGCMQTDEHNATQEEKEPFQNVQYSEQTKNTPMTNEQIASHLAEVASQSPNIQQATAVVIGPYAVVGIDLDEKLDQSRAGTIKYTVSEALREDPYGKTAVVIADGDINQRLQNINDKVKQGYPIQGIIEELAAIIGRYMPDIPPPENQPLKPDQNKELMPANEKEKLHDSQEEQSNQEQENE